MPPVPKPESTKKTRKPKGGPTKTVNMDAVDERRREQNNRNRNFGRSAEQNVARVTGGVRTPMSGAIKNSNFDLTGDVQVRDAAQRPFMKLEVKATSRFTPKGTRSFVFHWNVIEQMIKEAEDAHQIGALVVHSVNTQYERDDLWVFTAPHALQLIEWAKIGKAVEDGTFTQTDTKDIS